MLSAKGNAAQPGQIKPGRVPMRRRYRSTAMLIDYRHRTPLSHFRTWYRACRASGFGRIEALRCAIRFGLAS